MCRANFVESLSVLRPRVCPTSNTSLPAAGFPSTISNAQPALPKILFGDLPDPKNRYVVLKANQNFRRFEMCIPPVYLDDGSLVMPSTYEDSIPDGTLVAVRGKMKM